MPLSKAAATALAATVVSAAAVVSAVVPGGSGGAERVTAAASTTPGTPTAPTTASASTTADPDPRPLQAEGPRAPRVAGRPTVLFAGGTAMLRPRGGVARSFACLAATRLAWRCLVGAPAAVATSAADVVVVVAGPDDDAATVARALDLLPRAAPAGVPAPVTVVLGPVAAATDPTVTRRRDAIRRLATARGVRFVDPVALAWVTDPARELAAGGRQLTSAGHAALAGPLADTLRVTVTFAPAPATPTTVRVTRSLVAAAT